MPSTSNQRSKLIPTTYWTIAGAALPLGFSHALAPLGLLGLAMFLYGFLRNRTRITVGFVVAILVTAWVLWVQHWVPLEGGVWWFASAAVAALGIVGAVGIEHVWKSSTSLRGRG